MNPDVGPTDIDGFSRIKPPLIFFMQTSWYGIQKTGKTCRFGSDGFSFSIGRDFEVPAVKLQYVSVLVGSAIPILDGRI